MQLVVTNLDIEKAYIRSVRFENDNSLIGASYTIPSLGTFAGDILSLNFEWLDDGNVVRPRMDKAWKALVKRDDMYAGILYSANDIEDQENETQLAGTIIAALNDYFSIVIENPKYITLEYFEKYWAFGRLPEPPTPEKHLLPRNFSSDVAETKEDVGNWYDLQDSRNKGIKFFEELEQHGDSFDIDYIYDVRGFADLAHIAVYLTLRAGKTFSRCEHCGRLFIPARMGEKYCSRTSPKWRGQTCKEAAKYEKQLARERSSESTRIYKSVNTMLASRANSAKSEEAYNEAWCIMCDFRDKARSWREKMKAGAATEEEYIAFLNSYYKRRK